MNFGYWCAFHQLPDELLKKILDVSDKKLREIKKGEYTGDVAPLLKVMVLTQGKVKIEEMIHKQLLNELAALSIYLKKNKQS